jgi:putative aldouronate transport system permease protein
MRALEKTAKQARGSSKAARSEGIQKHPFLKDLVRDYQLHLIIALPVAWFVIFRYLPMYGAQIAFRDFLGAKGIWGSPWVGLKHFQKFFESYLFWRVVSNTLFLSLYTVAATFPIPVLLALSINNTVNQPYKKTVQMVVYAPYFISTVVMVGMLIQFLSPSIGIAGKLMRLVGMAPIGILGKPELFRSVYVWSHGTIIYLATLSSIDPELHQAAIIDGATRIQRTLHIDVPGILPTILIILVLTMGQVMNVGFEKAFLLQNELNVQTSEVIETYVYKIGLTGIPRFSYASAIGLFNSMINFVLIVTFNYVSKRVGGTSLW